MGNRFERKYDTQPGEYGSLRVIQSGRASGEMAKTILADVAYGELVKIPHTRGIAFKSFNGDVPAIELVTPPTMNVTLTCIKVAAAVKPMAPQQSGGSFDGDSVIAYQIVWQEVGELKR